VEQVGYFRGAKNSEKRVVINAYRAEARKASRFVVDENLGPELAPTLRNLGYNTTDTSTLKLKGRSDKDVFASAWHERRILLMQDRDFLDERRFPWHRNAGVVVLPAHNDRALINALVYALALVRQGREPREQVKMVVCEDGILTVISHTLLLSLRQ
jgi:predicted nuclease of predicted toxin-antitoxin system